VVVKGYRPLNQHFLKSPRVAFAPSGLDRLTVSATRPEKYSNSAGAGSQPRRPRKIARLPCDIAQNLSTAMRMLLTAAHGPGSSRASPDDNPTPPAAARRVNDETSIQSFRIGTHQASAIGFSNRIDRRNK
jgi:hypothetical protein